MERHRELLINNIIISPNISMHDSMILFRSFRFGLESRRARVEIIVTEERSRALNCSTLMFPSLLHHDVAGKSIITNNGVQF